MSGVRYCECGCSAREHARDGRRCSVHFLTCQAFRAARLVDVEQAIRDRAGELLDFIDADFRRRRRQWATRRAA